MAMNPELKKNWIEALRSGKFHQGIGSLNGEDINFKPGFCCLGVLCKIQSDQIKKDFNIHYDECNVLCCGENSGLLSPKFQNFVKISDYEMDYLYKSNDSGLSFSEIADWIEKNL